MPENERDEEDFGGLVIIGIIVLLSVGNYIWNIATDLPVEILANSIFLVGTIFSWGGIHYLLRDSDIELNVSRILVSELLPAATFSFALVFYTYPALIEFLFGTPPTYVQKGIFWDVMQVIGAIMITASTIGWISLITDE